MGKHLGITKPDPCIMLFIRQILQRAKEDNVSLGFFDLSKQQTNVYQSFILIDYPN